MGVLPTKSIKKLLSATLYRQINATFSPQTFGHVSAMVAPRLTPFFLPKNPQEHHLGDARGKNPHHLCSANRWNKVRIISA